MVKNPPAKQKMQVQYLGWEGEGNGNLPGEIPWTEEPGRLQAMGSQESDMT